MMNEDGKTEQKLQKWLASAKRFGDGKSNINAFLDDYAYTIEAFISLYEATFDEKWIYAAKKLADYVLSHFNDSDSQMFFYTSDIDDPLITRKIDFSDNVTPSSNSSFAIGLIKLSKFFFEEGYEELASKLINSIKQSALKNPSFHAYWLTAAMYLAYPYYEVGIIGDESFDKRNLLVKEYFPNIVMFGSREGGSLDVLKERFVKGKTLIYICENGTCQLPVEEVGKAVVHLKK